MVSSRKYSAVLYSERYFPLVTFNCIKGDVSPASPTLTTSAGEDVTLTMTRLYNGPSTELRWKHNGNDVTAWNGQSNVTINSVQIINAGIYECYRDAYYSQQKHALMKLIVRGKTLQHLSPRGRYHLGYSPIPRPSQSYVR